MQKIAYLGVLLLIVYSCSVFKSGENRISSEKLTENLSDKEDLGFNNLTRNSFYIKSIDIEFRDGKSINNFNGSVRFEKPDKYLISLRSKTGIEFTRVFINRDSVYIMDRLQRKVYGGPVRYIRKNFGLPVEILPVFFGDFIGKCSFFEKDKLSESNHVVNCTVASIDISYRFDRFVEKPVSMSAESFNGNELGTIDYSKFKRINGCSYPSRILFVNSERTILADLKIKKIEVPWNEKIEFNIGNRYKILELL